MKPTPSSRSPIPLVFACAMCSASFCIGSSLPGEEAVKPPAAEKPAPRSFAMGFTPFPWDMTQEALKGTRAFIVQNADFVAHHFDNGVPWTEALEEKPFHAAVMADWEGRKDLSRGKKVLLSLTPLNGGRKGLALYRAEKENMPLPEAFKGKALNDPIVKKAYLAYCQKAVDFFRPSHLAIVIEANELILNAPAKWPDLLALYEETYKALKLRHPDLPICATITLHALTDPAKRSVNEQEAKVREFLAQNDFAGISYYPFMQGNMKKPEEPLDWLMGFTSKPVAITETGFPAETIRLKTISLTLESDASLQAAFFEKLLERAERDRYLFVTCFLHRDYDALWEKIKATAPEFFIVWKDCGLLDEDGKERPAFQVWKKYFLESLQEPGK